jgi:hypothetical protein
VRRNIYQKLGLRHKGDLVEYAAQHGFVRFSRGSVLRPDYQPQLAAYATRRTRANRTAGEIVAAA